jgi:hypothetical protein
MLHQLHQLRVTVRATFVNLHQDFTTPLSNYHNLMDDQRKKGRLFLCLSFVPNDIPLRGKWRVGFHSSIYEEPSS